MLSGHYVVMPTTVAQPWCLANKRGDIIRLTGSITDAPDTGSCRVDMANARAHYADNLGGCACCTGWCSLRISHCAT